MDKDTYYSSEQQSIGTNRQEAHGAYTQDYRRNARQADAQDPYAQFDAQREYTQVEYERIQHEKQAQYEQKVYARKQAYARQRYEQEELARQHMAQQQYEVQQRAYYRQAGYEPPQERDVNARANPHNQGYPQQSQQAYQRPNSRRAAQTGTPTGQQSPRQRVTAQPYVEQQDFSQLPPAPPYSTQQNYTHPRPAQPYPTQQNYAHPRPAQPYSTQPRGRHSAPAEKSSLPGTLVKYAVLIVVIIVIARLGYSAVRMAGMFDNSVKVTSATPPPEQAPESTIEVVGTPMPAQNGSAVDNPASTTDNNINYADDDDLDNDDTPILDVAVPIYQKAALNKSRINVLLLGDDAKPSAKRGRTDTMILLSYDRATNTVDMISFLRDTLVPIEGHDYGRLNAAYSFGGPGLMINTLNTYYDLDIQDYVICRFETLVQIVDQLGGLPATLTPKEADYVSTRKEMKAVGFGDVVLNGRQALAYARIRKIDSDVQRASRQQKVIKSLVNKIVSLRNPNILLSLMETVASSLTMNLSQTEVLSLGLEVLQAKDLQLNSHTIPYGRTFSFVKYKNMNVIQANREENVLYLRNLLGGGK